MPSPAPPSGPFDASVGEALCRVLDLARTLFDVPVAFVWTPGENGAAPALLARGLDLEVTACSFCSAVHAADDVLVLGEAEPAAPSKEDPFLHAVGAHFAAGVALERGGTDGVLAILDRAPRAFSSAQRSRLKHLAQVVSAVQVLGRSSEAFPEDRPAASLPPGQPPLFASISRNISEGIYRSTPDGRILFANEAMARLFGHDDPADLHTVPAQALYRSLERRVALVRKTSAHLGFRNEEVEFVRKDGTTFWGLISCNAVLDDAGRVVAYDGALADITELKRTEVALRASEARNRALLQAIPDALFLLDRRGVFVDYRPARGFETLLPPDEFLGRAVQETMPPAVAQATMQHIEQALETGVLQTFEYALEVGGTTAHFEARVVPQSDDTALAIIRDVTDRHTTVEALRESEERWRRLVEYHPEPIMVSVEARIVYLNAAGARLFGLAAPEEVYGHPVHEFVPAEEVGEVNRRAATIRRGERTKPREFEVRGRDRRRLYVEATSVPIFYQGRPAAQTIMRDTTQRRRHEQALVEAHEEALEIARLKSAFLARLSHEIRTPLTAILGFADVLVEEADAKTREFAELIRQSGDRLRQTIHSVLDLARLEGGTLELAPEHVDVVERVEKVLDLFRVQARQRGLLLQVVAPEAPVSARLDPGAFDRILTNLVSNAVKFTPEGQVQVVVVPDDAVLEVRVEDTGVGIGAAFLPRLFGEFSREASGLQSEHEGSGLGLAITKRLVELMGGTIEVASTKGEGTLFTVRLPGTLHPDPQGDDGGSPPHH